MRSIGRTVRSSVVPALLLLVGIGIGYGRASTEATVDAAVTADVHAAAEEPASVPLFPSLPDLPVEESTAEGSLIEDAPLVGVRFFKEVKEGSFSTAYNALSRLNSNGDFVLLVETDKARNPISDTLLVWVQHHAADRPLAQEAAWADMIIACYPELLAPADLQHHVLPEARGKIWLYFLKGQHLIVSDQRFPALDFALKGL